MARKRAKELNEKQKMLLTIAMDEEKTENFTKNMMEIKYRKDALFFLYTLFVFLLGITIGKWI